MFRLHAHLIIKFNNDPLLQVFVHVFVCGTSTVQRLGYT